MNKKFCETCGVEIKESVKVPGVTSHGKPWLISPKTFNECNRKPNE